MAELINASDSLNEGRKKLNAIAKEMNDKDVASMPEIVNARGGEPNLKARLDKTDTQLAEKVGGKVKLKPEEFSDEALALVTGNGTVNVLSIPQDGSVSPKSTNDISGLNMYPFQRKAILSEDEAIALQISRAIKNVKLYKANEMLDYRITTIRKLQYNQTRDLYDSGVWVSDSNNNVVSCYVKSSESTDDVEIEGLKKIELREWNQSGISGEILINWSVLPVGFHVNQLGFDETGLDIKTISNGLEQYMTTENESWVV